MNVSKVASLIGVISTMSNVVLAGSVQYGSAEPVWVPACDARILYEGRFDETHLADRGIGVPWQGSRIVVEFEGAAIQLGFSEVVGQNYFNAEIGGERRIIELCEGKAPVGTEWTGLGSGLHRLTIFKRSEGQAGSLRFTGVKLPPGAKLHRVNPPNYALKVVFLGDSITAGDCSEEPPSADQWLDRRSENNAITYGALVAQTFNADYRNFSVSGIGLTTGWAKPNFIHVWDRIAPWSDSPRADLSIWKPDIIFINLGENDAGFTRSKGLPFPTDEFVASYRELVCAIRHYWSDSHIVLLRGGMTEGATNEKLAAAWNAVAVGLESGDPGISHFAFRGWSKLHPRASDHAAMAEELIVWLRGQTWFRDMQHKALK